jgi:hypothetical protein
MATVNIKDKVFGLGAERDSNYLSDKKNWNYYSCVRADFWFFLTRGSKECILRKSKRGEWGEI